MPWHQRGGSTNSSNTDEWPTSTSPQELQKPSKNWTEKNCLQQSTGADYWVPKVWNETPRIKIWQKEPRGLNIVKQRLFKLYPDSKQGPTYLEYDSDPRLRYFRRSSMLYNDRSTTSVPQYHKDETQQRFLKVEKRKPTQQLTNGSHQGTRASRKNY